MWFIKNSFLNECWGLIWTITNLDIKRRSYFQTKMCNTTDRIKDGVDLWSFWGKFHLT